MTSFYSSLEVKERSVVTRTHHKNTVQWLTHYNTYIHYNKKENDALHRTKQCEWTVKIFIPSHVHLLPLLQLIVLLFHVIQDLVISQNEVSLLRITMHKMLS